MNIDGYVHKYLPLISLTLLSPSPSEAWAVPTFCTAHTRA